MHEEIDTTIQGVEALYRAVSGREANGGEPTPLPPEKDASKHVDEQLDRLLISLANMPAIVPAPAWAPAVFVVEDEEDLVICVDLPSVQREQISVTATSLSITVTGHRPAPKGQLRSAEAPLGAFHREIALPPGLPVTELHATLKDGVLELRIPQRLGSPTQPITVR
jgi:HSP20 family protein